MGVNSSQSVAAAQNATYDIKRYNFVDPLDSRGLAFQNFPKDTLYQNVIIDSYKDKNTETLKLYVKKRFGTSTVNTPFGSGAARGLFYTFGNLLLAAVGNSVYNATSGSPTPILTWSFTTTGTVGFVEATGATRYSFICDGREGYVINAAGVATKVTDVDFPSPHVPTPVFIDGYIFLPKEGTADIYNCDLEAPLSWNASAFITAEQFPDNCIGLARQNNQVVAFGTDSIQFFYNAANAAPNSPLASTNTTTLQLGLRQVNGIGTIAQTEKLCTFVCQSSTGGLSVWTIDGFEASKISTPAIERAITPNGADTGYNIRWDGHFFYVLNDNSSNKLSYIYDYDTKEWVTWNSLTRAGGTQCFIGVFAANSTGNVWVLSPEKEILTLNESFGAGGSDIVVDRDGELNSSIESLIRITKYDLGNVYRKIMYGLYLICDISPYNGQVHNTIDFRWSDDDSNTWSNWKTLSLESTPYFKRLGYFRRRTFEFRHTAARQFRLEAFDIETNQGMH